VLTSRSARKGGFVLGIRKGKDTPPWRRNIILGTPILILDKTKITKGGELFTSIFRKNQKFDG